MTWINKVKKEGIDISKLGKKLSEKIRKYNEDADSLKEIEASKSSLSGQDLEDYEDIKKLLESQDQEICADLDKYLANKDMNAARVIKMQEGRKKAAEAKKANGGSAAPTAASNPVTVVTPQDTIIVANPAGNAGTTTQTAEQGGTLETKDDKQVEEQPKKSKGFGYWILGGAVVLLTAGAAINYFKNRE